MVRKLKKAKNPQKAMFDVINKNTSYKKKNKNNDIESLYINSSKNVKTHDQGKIVDILNKNYVNFPRKIHENLT